MKDIVPDYFYALVGYRAWCAGPEGDLLSLGGMSLWPARTKHIATCSVIRDSIRGRMSTTVFSHQPAPIDFSSWWERRRAAREARGHHAPEAKCSCGIYAAKSDKSSYYHEYAHSASVWGEVYLWGKIQEYTEGYRAEFAYPKSLRTTDATLAPKIAERYGVSCEVDVRAMGDVYDPLRQEVSGVPLAAILGGGAPVTNWLKALLRVYGPSR